MFVYHAYLDVKWESPRDLGLFIKKSDAKQACQDDAPESRLVWDNSDRHRSFAQSPVFSDSLYIVARRPVR